MTQNKGNGKSKKSLANNAAWIVTTIISCYLSYKFLYNVALSFQITIILAVISLGISCWILLYGFKEFNERKEILSLGLLLFTVSLVLFATLQDAFKSMILNNRIESAEVFMDGGDFLSAHEQLISCKEKIATIKAKTKRDALNEKITPKFNEIYQAISIKDRDIFTILPDNTNFLFTITLKDPELRKLYLDFIEFLKRSPEVSETTVSNFLIAPFRILDQNKFKMVVCGASLVDISQWKEDYIPDNMCCLITGDFQSEKLMELAQKVFSSFKMLDSSLKIDTRIFKGVKIFHCIVGTYGLELSIFPDVVIFTNKNIEEIICKLFLVTQPSKHPPQLCEDLYVKTKDSIISFYYNANIILPAEFESGGFLMSMLDGPIFTCIFNGTLKGDPFNHFKKGFWDIPNKDIEAIGDFKEFSGVYGQLNMNKDFEQIMVFKGVRLTKKGRSLLRENLKSTIGDTVIGITDEGVIFKINVPYQELQKLIVIESEKVLQDLSSKDKNVNLETFMKLIMEYPKHINLKATFETVQNEIRGYIEIKVEKDYAKAVKKEYVKFFIDAFEKSANLNQYKEAFDYITKKIRNKFELQ